MGGFIFAKIFYEFHRPAKLSILSTAEITRFMVFSLTIYAFSGQVFITVVCTKMPRILLML